MKKNMVRISVIILVLALLLPSTAFAMMEASDYLSYYNAYITKSGNTIYVNFDVQGTLIMDYVGVTEIYLYEKTSPSGSWSFVKTFLSSNPAYTSSMIGTYTNFKDDYVSYSGNSSYQYKAYVTVYAEKDGGSDSRTVTAT